MAKSICAFCSKSYTNKSKHLSECSYILSYVYRCINCKFFTNRKGNYIRHINTDIHKINNHICCKCNHTFINSYQLTRHLNKKINNTCGAPLTSVSAPSIINSNTTTNNYTTINNPTYYTLVLDPMNYNGSQHKYVKNLLRNDVIPLTSEISCSVFSNTLYDLISCDLTKLCNLLSTTNLNLEDFTNLKSSNVELRKLSRSKLIPIETEFSNLQYNNLYLYPSFDRSNILYCKVWLNPRLLTTEELIIINSECDEWIYNNASQINNYLTLKIKDAFSKTYMNINNSELWNLFPNRERIYYKDDDIPFTKLKELTNDIIISLIDKQDDINALLFDKLSQYQITDRLFTFDYLTINKIIYGELLRFIKNDIYLT